MAFKDKYWKTGVEDFLAYKGKKYNGEYPTFREVIEITEERYPDNEAFKAIVPEKLTFTYREALKKIKEIAYYLVASGAKKGDKIAVPNDPTNEGRALRVLENAGLVKLAKDFKLTDGLGGIVENPLKLKFVELEPALLPRALDDVQASVINANYALQAGFNPAKNAIALEAKSSPFGNVVVVRKGDAQKEAFQKLKKVITSPEVKKFIEDKYQGGVIPTF